MSKGMLAAVCGALAIGAGAVAFGAIPDGGVIHACYKKDGNLRVIDPAAKGDAAACKKDETPLDWSQTGPKGDPGAPGDQGPAGPSFAKTAYATGIVEGHGCAPWTVVSTPVETSTPVLLNATGAGTYDEGTSNLLGVRLHIDLIDHDSAQTVGTVDEIEAFLADPPGTASVAPEAVSVGGVVRDSNGSDPLSLQPGRHYTLRLVASPINGSCDDTTVPYMYDSRLTYQFAGLQP